MQTCDFIYGLQLVEVHRILKFRQSAWIKPYIDFNTAKRLAAKSSFLQSHYTNLNNMLFGKTMKSLPKRMDLEMLTNPTRAKKLIAKPGTLHWDIINEKLVSVRKQKPKIIVDRPIYLGLCSLQLSKITMYKFHYEEILSKYGSRAKLAYTYTGYFIYHIQTYDLYKDTSDNLNAYDTFDYPVNHPSTQRLMPRS